MGMRLSCLVLGVVSVWGLPGATISFTFNGSVNTSTVDRTLNSGTNWTNGMSVGQMRVTVTSSSGFAGPVPGIFWTFCVEPQEGITAGNSYTYTIDPLQNAPTNVAGGMGAVKADLLRELYGRYYTSFLDGSLSVVTASALQVATWEIVRETSGTYNVTTGTTQFRNPSNASVLTTANTMLASLTGNTSFFLSELYAIRVTGNQDLAFRAVVPEPSTWLMAGVGFGLAVLRVRAGQRLAAAARKTNQSSI